MATNKKTPPPSGSGQGAGLKPLPPPRPPEKQLTIEKSWGRPSKTKWAPPSDKS